MVRIVKKKMAVNNPHDLRITYVVDGWLICPTKKKAEDYVKKYRRK